MPKSPENRQKEKNNQYLKYNITIKYALLSEITFVFVELVQNRKEKIFYLNIFQHKFKNTMARKKFWKKNIPKLEWTKNQIIEKET